MADCHGNQYGVLIMPSRKSLEKTYGVTITKNTCGSYCYYRIVGVDKIFDTVTEVSSFLKGENKIDMKNIIDFYGVYPQARIAMEECAELIQAISKRLRYPKDKKRKDNLIEEMADVLICIEQLKIMFDISEKEIQEWIFKKEKRVFERLREDKKNV